MSKIMVIIVEEMEEEEAADRYKDDKGFEIKANTDIEVFGVISSMVASSVKKAILLEKRQ